MARTIEQAGVATRAVVRLGSRDGAPAGPDDAVVVEEPLEIRVDGETVAVTMRTPGDDARLALGFLFSEGILAGLDDVGSIAPCGRPGSEGYGNAIELRSAPGKLIDVDRILEGRRWAPSSAACGVCGRRSIEELLSRCGTVPPGPGIAAANVPAAVAGLLQPAFARTGGIHAAAIFDASGCRLASHEDVGRHNAVDKCVGALLQARRLGTGAGAGPAPTILAVSGRCSFEIVQKAAMAKIPVIAAVSAATSLSIDLAAACGIALAAFVRPGGMNVYGDASRIA